MIDCGTHSRTPSTVPRRYPALFTAFTAIAFKLCAERTAHLRASPFLPSFPRPKRCLRLHGRGRASHGRGRSRPSSSPRRRQLRRLPPAQRFFFFSITVAKRTYRKKRQKQNEDFNTSTRIAQYHINRRALSAYLTSISIFRRPDGAAKY